MLRTPAPRAYSGQRLNQRRCHRNSFGREPNGHTRPVAEITRNARGRQSGDCRATAHCAERGDETPRRSSLRKNTTFSSASEAAPPRDAAMESARQRSSSRATSSGTPCCESRATMRARLRASAAIGCDDHRAGSVERSRTCRDDCTKRVRDERIAADDASDPACECVGVALRLRRPMAYLQERARRAPRRPFRGVPTRSGLQRTRRRAPRKHAHSRISRHVRRHLPALRQ